MRLCVDCGVSEDDAILCFGGAPATPGVGPRLICADCDAQAERDWVDEDPDHRRHSLDTFAPYPFD